MDVSTSEARERRKRDAEEFADDLAQLDGVAEVQINDASPKTWQEVEYFVYLDGEETSVGMDTRGNLKRRFNLADNVNLRSLSQRLPHVIENHEKTSLVFQILERPTKVNDHYDQGHYVIDVGFP